MKLKKSLVGIVLVLVLALVLTGCSQNQQVIFHAAMNLQDAKSMHSHTTMTVNLSGSGFDPAAQQQIDTAAAFLNKAQLDFDLKSNGNEEKTINQSKMDMNLTAQGMDFDLLCWVDMNLAADKPKLVETFQLPQVAKATLPTPFASKQYMVLNPFENSGDLDASKLTAFSKDFYKAELAFLQSYSKRFNPSIDFAKIGTKNVQFNGNTKSADIYELKLNDAQFKELLRYTVNNFAQDSEAMSFVKEYMDTVLSLTQVSDRAKAISDFDQAFQQFDQNKEQFLTNFNSVMDQLNNVSLLGAKGIDLRYVICQGYCVEKSGTIDLQLNMAELNQLMNAFKAPQSAPVSGDVKGTLGLQINFNTEVSAINSTMSIGVPQVNSDNSFNYTDLLKSIPVQSQSAEQPLTIK